MQATKSRIDGTVQLMPAIPLVEILQQLHLTEQLLT